ncbi:phage tail sheath C-terminal domain-containing protein [Stigmatella sp. ncwal1]|uniref:Phage tail sheath C-terminal domain-containing protein n=1 Tax=Stigmatella ashevillensis TaxID=2995309 RepID=A0ABT5DG41_9BACT|nr:phage tail sheath C-terminal domain-containing protein [Stigmatella ashevillena]MDC0712044.1 phage tail sheath C-terminal domain-containing protein [Stigmatella ashevillena]
MSPTDVTLPGVYIEEDANLSLSITTNLTAVPVFACGDRVTASFARFDSWSSYSRNSGGAQEDSTLHAAIRAYFENGGGYCYLVPTSKLLEEVPLLADATLLVAAGQDIRTAASKLCTEESGLFAILDGPEAAITSADLEKYDANSQAAVYYPWLKADWAKVNIPPSAALAGVYCGVDRSRGVWKTPANVPLRGGLTPLHAVSDSEQAQYQEGKAVNMIRQFSGAGVVVWGARTLSAANVNWRYVPVRRLFNSAQRDIARALSVAIFEPNTQPTWERVKGAIENYLHNMWQQGALQGAKLEEAFFVQVGKGTTMTDDDISQGRMIVKVGMAAVRPAEFIIMQFTQNMEA